MSREEKRGGMRVNRTGTELITKWLQKGKSIAEIAENLDRTEEYVKKFM